MMRALVCALLALAAGAPAWAAGPCPGRADAQSSDLLGTWEASFDGDLPRALLLLQGNREHPQSLSGAISRQGDKALLAGDLSEGVFNLEESSDGVSIAAVWTGEVVESSCAREIRGRWRDARQGREAAFVLRRSSGW